MRPLAGRPSDEIVEALQVYKKKNPVKYEMKKAALFARYGLNVLEDEVKIEEVKDESDVELEVIKKKVSKKVTKE